MWKTSTESLKRREKNSVNVVWTAVDIYGACVSLHVRISVFLCVWLCMWAQVCTCWNLWLSNDWYVSCDRVNPYMCMCERVSEDSIWTVPSLPVGRGTTWLSVNHSLTSNLLGSHTQRHAHTHASKPRYLHIRRYASTLGQPAVLSGHRSHIETEGRDWGKSDSQAGGLDCFLRLREWVWNSLRFF